MTSSVICSQSSALRQMRILVVHNHYGRFAVGGEANVVDAEVKLLAAHGHEVKRYERTNAEIYEEAALKDKIGLLKNVDWSWEAYEDIRKVLIDFRPDVMHVHNYWFVLTPSILAAAKECNVGTVLTLHNYRLVCPGNQFLRKGKVCELCVKGNPYRILWHRCFPGGSLLKSILSLKLYLATRRRDFLVNWVDAYISLSHFGKAKFVECGLPEEKIYVKPNFLEDPLTNSHHVTPGNGAVFVGRLSPEKGLKTLMQSWRGIDYPLSVVGDGPLMEELKGISPDAVRFAGLKSRAETIEMIKNARFMVFPSEWYETFGLSILEALALGKPVIASNLGPRCELVQDGVNGLLFEAGNAEDLREKVLCLSKDDELVKKLSVNARQSYLEKYTPGANYTILEGIYRKCAA